MGRLGIVSLGLRGSLAGSGETIYQPAVFFELPVDGYFEKELEYEGNYQNELLRIGWYEIEKVESVEGVYSNELDLEGQYEKELEYEGEYNVGN